MSPCLNVYSLPHVVQPEEMAGGSVVVIDVLRASTTICHALVAGAAEVIPCVEVDEAKRIAADLPGKVLLGGERKGLPIDGFDLGNSPSEYTHERVADATLVFTTTNGTRALNHARLADRVLMGAFVNASAVVRQLLDQKQIHILCAGTNGEYSEDDILLAGFLVQRLERHGAYKYSQNVQAVTAREYWLHSFAEPQALGVEPLDPALLVPKLRMSAGGRNLLAVDLEADITDAAQLDRFEGIPEYNPATGRIHLT